jgi:hypothetical protein
MLPVYPPYNFWMPKPTFMKLCVYIMTPEPISTAYFINPSHQSVSLLGNVYVAFIRTKSDTMLNNQIKQRPVLVFDIEVFSTLVQILYKTRFPETECHVLNT